MVMSIAMRRDDRDAGAELTASIAQLSWIDCGHVPNLRNAVRPGISVEGAGRTPFQPSSAAAAAAKPDRRRKRMRLLETTSPSLHRTDGGLYVLKCCRNRAVFPLLQDPKRKSCPTRICKGWRFLSSATKSAAVRRA